jgi:hypothetical protein
MSLVAFKLLERIRKAGGEVRLSRDGKLQCRNVPPVLKQRLARNHLRVQTWLAEEHASKAWVASGRDPNWWRHYHSPLGNVYITPACTCSKYPFAHIHGDPGPEPNFQLNGADPFDAMKDNENKSDGSGKYPLVFHPITAWPGQFPEAPEIKKGEFVRITGRLNYTKWTGKDGVERNGVEIVASSITVNPKPVDQPKPITPNLHVTDADLPF